MAIIYTRQTFLRIKVTTGIDITGITSAEIKYKKPGGATGSLTAEVESLATGIIYADLSEDLDILDVAGNWLFWASLTFNDGRSARGESFEVTVLPNS